MGDCMSLSHTDLAQSVYSNRTKWLELVFNQIHSFNKYLSSNYILGSVLGPGETTLGIRKALLA